MSPEKTTALVLSVTPYRETSCLVRLLTPAHGLIHGVAKGVKGKGHKKVFIDRGFILETVLYIKPNRDLHTLGSINVVSFYPGVRNDLLRSVIRDTALELILKSINQSVAHPELYNMICKFMDMLDNAGKKFIFPLLFHFFYEFLKLLGFKISITRCLKCGKSLCETGGFLLIAHGAMICPACRGSVDPSFYFPPGVLAFLEEINTSGEVFDDFGECLRITEAFVAFSRYHLDIRRGFNTMDFLEKMV